MANIKKNGGKYVGVFISVMSNQQPHELFVNSHLFLILPTCVYTRVSSSENCS